MTSEGIELRHAIDIDDVWNTLIEVYAEVRADQLHQPHYSVERYGERLARHAAEPGWEAVIGYDGDEPVGYAYVNTIASDDRWWRRMTTPLPEGVTERPTVARKEIMLRVPWRGTGVARRIHDELLAHRPEEQVSLLVNPLNGEARSRRCTSVGATGKSACSSLPQTARSSPPCCARSASLPPRPARRSSSVTTYATRLDTADTMVTVASATT